MNTDIERIPETCLGMIAGVAMIWPSLLKIGA